MKRNLFLRIAGLLMVLSMGLSCIWAAKAKYVEILPANQATFYLLKAGKPTYMVGFGHDGGTPNVNSSTITTSMQSSYFTKFTLKAGWWAFVLRGGRGSWTSATSGQRRDNNTTGSGSTGNGGTTGCSGLVYGCKYFPVDTDVYACAGAAGAIGSTSTYTSITGNAAYGGGKGGGSGTRTYGNGGGASLLTMGDAPSAYTGTSNGALTVSSAPYSSYRNYLFNNRYKAIIAVAGGGGGDGGGGDDPIVFGSGNGAYCAKVTGGNGGVLTSPNGSSGYTVANGTKGKPFKAGSGNNQTAGFGGGDVATTDGQAIWLSSFYYTDSNASSVTNSGVGNGGGKGGGIGVDNYGNTGWFLQGGDAPSSSYAGGGGSGWCGGGSGGQDGTFWDDGAGGGGSSFAAQYVYPLPTTGVYKFAYDYFNAQGYFTTTGSANANGLVCLLYMGVDYNPSGTNYPATYPLY